MRSGGRQGTLSGSTRVTVVGEALVDLLWRAGAREAAAVPGGSPANVAVGLHRLDRPVTLVTTWADDPPGTLVAEYLAGTGADVRRVPAGSSRTTVALAYLDDSGSAAYDFLAAWDPRELPVPEDTAVLHAGSLGIIVEPGASRVLRLCREQHRRGRTVVADLNVRPAVQPDRGVYRAACRLLSETADVVKASEEDLSFLFPDLGPVGAAGELMRAGPALTVVTLGARGAVAVTRSGQVHAPAPAVPVVDTVGAGDAFQAALLDAVAEHGGPPTGSAALTAVLTRCTAAAALTCMRTGADPPSRAELANPAFP